MGSTADAFPQLQPGDLKAGVEQALNALLVPIQEDYAKDPEFQIVAELAYPSEQPEKKKKKKEKKIGTGYASKDKQKGAATAAAVADGQVKPEEAVAKAVGTGAEDAMEKLGV
jgi:tyrosyl-tRNA synthetase